MTLAGRVERAGMIEVLGAADQIRRWRFGADIVKASHTRISAG
jgi:hypothetical protein